MNKSDEVILKAARIANYYHSGQFRKYGYKIPYIMHPIRVAGLISIHPDSTPEMVAASYLHDTLEDTNYPKMELLKDFGPIIYELVDCLTNPSKGMNLSRDDRKRIDREHVYQCSKEVKLIKMADRIDNLQDLSKAPLDFIIVYVKESEKLLNESLQNVDEVYEYMYKDALKTLYKTMEWKEKKEKINGM